MRIIRSSYKGIKGSMFLVYLPYCTVKSKLSYHYFAFRTKAHKAVKRKLKSHVRSGWRELLISNRIEKKSIGAISSLFHFILDF